MENIQVAMRLRPLNGKEEDAGETGPWKVKNNVLEIDKSHVDTSMTKAKGKAQFFYDHCFQGSVNNETVYQTCAKKVIMSCLEGYNGTIFMYGQTGSGKTYTMLGYKNQDGVYNQALADDVKAKAIMEVEKKLDDDGEEFENLHEKYPEMMYDSNKVDMGGNNGILIQSLKDIFKTIEADEEKTYFLKCSYFEIYNDQIYDLLKPRGAIGDPLTLMEDAKRDHFIIRNLTEHSVTSINEIFERLKKGEVNRHYAETFMNHSSSRSHTLFRITVKAVTNSFIRNYRHENKDKSNLNIQELIIPDEDNENHGTVVTESYLNFVDLAGSERISTHMNWIDDDEDDKATKIKNVQDSRMKEGRSINKSLFFLTQVIGLKAEGKANQHIPFRNSPLTKILRSSLGGNFRTLVVLCLNPCLSQLEVSLSTLRFGMNAKKIQNAVRANIVTNNNDESIKILIENYEKKMRDLQSQRDEDLLKYQQYAGMIDELRLQRSILLERLEQANKKLSIKIADEIPERDLYMFFRQAQTKVAVMKDAGLLFVPKNQTKYDNIKEVDGETDAGKLKKAFDEEMRTTSKDFVNKFALQAYNKVKAEFDDVKETVEKHREYMQQLCQSFKTVIGFMGQLSSLGEVYLSKLHVMSEQYQDEYLVANERQLKLDLYEKCKGFSLLSDKDLSRMKEYVLDLRESVKSEIDRRELIALPPEEMPETVLAGLKELRQQEEDDQEHKLTVMKRKIMSFVSFREGCQSEIEYYKEMVQEFGEQQKIDDKAKELDEFINDEMAGITERVRKMDQNFKSLDSQLQSTEKKNLDKKLAEYQTKFEKLVDLVLSQGKKKDKPIVENVKVEESSKEPSPEASLNNSPGPNNRKAAFLRKSQTISLEEDKAGKGAERSESKQNPNSKIRAWLTLKQIEEEPLSYGSMMGENESAMGRSVAGLNYMTGNNLAIINEKASNDDNVSNRSFSIKDDKNSKGRAAFHRGKTVIGNDNVREERSSVRLSAAPVVPKRPRIEERRSHIVGRSTESPFANGAAEQIKETPSNIFKSQDGLKLAKSLTKKIDEIKINKSKTPDAALIARGLPLKSPREDFDHHSSCSSMMEDASSKSPMLNNGSKRLFGSNTALVSGRSAKLINPTDNQQDSDPRSMANLAKLPPKDGNAYSKIAVAGGSLETFGEPEEPSKGIIEEKQASTNNLITTPSQQSKPTSIAKTTEVRRGLISSASPKPNREDNSQKLDLAAIASPPDKKSKNITPRNNSTQDKPGPAGIFNDRKSSVKDLAKAAVSATTKPVAPKRGDSANIKTNEYGVDLFRRATDSQKREPVSAKKDAAKDLNIEEPKKRESPVKDGQPASKKLTAAEKNDNLKDIQIKRPETAKKPDTTTEPKSSKSAPKNDISKSKAVDTSIGKNVKSNGSKNDLKSSANNDSLVRPANGTSFDSPLKASGSKKTSSSVQGKRHSESVYESTKDSSKSKATDVLSRLTKSPGETGTLFRVSGSFSKNRK